VNIWLTAALGLLPPLAAAGWLTATGTVANRLVALELAGTLTVFALVLLSVGYSQPSFVDLALTLVLLSFAGTLVYVHFVERWL
jgi:multisubunit Na+/H+ antiporter MnhF subunit